MAGLEGGDLCVAERGALSSLLLERNESTQKDNEVRSITKRAQKRLRAVDSDTPLQYLDTRFLLPTFNQLFNLISFFQKTTNSFCENYCK